MWTSLSRQRSPPPLMSSSSLMSSHGVALATAVAVSGAVILIALCRPKPFSLPAATLDRNPTPPCCHRLRSCMSSSGERKRERRNKKQQQQKEKRVQFAAEVVEFDASIGNEEVEDFLEQRRGERQAEEERRRARGIMPANRVALYNGILRDRVMQRMACCY